MRPVRIDPTKQAAANFTDRDVVRFLNKIDMSGPCWLWTGGHNGIGYGQFHKFDAGGSRPGGRSEPRPSNGSRTRYAHRVAYELFIGPIAEGMTLDHTCGNGRGGCVTPDHLEVVTNAENNRRGASPTATNARKTECSKGHPFDEANTLWHEGKRRCRVCRDAANLARDPEALRVASRERWRRAHWPGYTSPIE